MHLPGLSCRCSAIFHFNSWNFESGSRCIIWHDVQLLSSRLQQVGSDEEAQVLRLRVAPEVGEVGQALVGGHPDQENPKDGFKEEGVGVVDDKDPIGANVILDIVQGED